MRPALADFADAEVIDTKAVAASSRRRGPLRKSRARRMDLQSVGRGFEPAAMTGRHRRSLGIRRLS